jgi:hypothetical protein
MWLGTLIRVIAGTVRIAPAAAFIALLGYLGIKHVQEHADLKPEKFDDYDPVEEYEKNRKDPK